MSGKKIDFEPNQACRSLISLTGIRILPAEDGSPLIEITSPPPFFPRSLRCVGVELEAVLPSGESSFIHGRMNCLGTDGRVSTYTFAPGELENIEDIAFNAQEGTCNIARIVFIFHPTRLPMPNRSYGLAA